MTTNLDTDLITIAEAARRLRVSALTIKRWIAQGRLLAYRVGPRQIRIRSEDLPMIVSLVTPSPRILAADKEQRDIWAGYDPEKVKDALRKSAGALAGVDRHALFQDIHAARRQASRGRPA
ncbi:MAG: helix-turn-helix domain-containing protein [Chloroflexi bacterium]|nr:helix-turn-helix domain-containing protein [Chloroflexota bacterium]